MSIRTAALALAALLAFATGASAQNALQVPRLVVAAGAELPVELRALRIRGEVSGSLALTSVEMVFHNPNRRILEGELQFPLLDGQIVIGLALDIDGKLREAVPVDKARGQAVFEDVTRQRIDPALLEATQGNNYKLRVYPIPAQGERRVVIRYSETLGLHGGQRVYRLPLDYAARLREFALALRVAGTARPNVTQRGTSNAVAFHAEGDHWVSDVKRADFVARGLLELAIPFDGKATPVVQRFDDGVYFHVDAPARVRPVPPQPVRPRTLPRTVQIVWDSSGSGKARDLPRETSLLDAYFKAARNIEVHLVRVRDAAEPVATFVVNNGDWSALRRALEATAYDGATNLAAALADADAGEVLLFSDGLANFGEARFATRAVPVYAVSSHARADAGNLRRIAETSGGRYIDLTSDSQDEAREKLLRTATRLVSIDGEGLRDIVAASVFPSNGRIAISGMLADARGTLRMTVEHPGGRREEMTIPIVSAREEGRLAATVWASARIRELESDYDANRGEIRRLGRRFNLATRETSLIVLDRVEDYARYEIVPPAELAEAYARIMATRAQSRVADQRSHLERIVKLFEEKQRWWEREYPRDAPALISKLKDASPGRQDAASVGIRGQSASGNVEQRVLNSPRAETPPPPARPAPALSRSSPVAAAEPSSPSTPSGGDTIRLRPWTPGSPYAARLRGASRDSVYRIYLDERPDYLQSTAFFLDAADVLFEKGQPELALRVLSNLAEMDLENRHILRILGYRLVQAARHDLAIPVFRKVLALSPEEPQSYRDLALALAGAREYQQAVDLLHEVVVKPWHGRFPEVELIALAELNAIVATSGQKLDLTRIDPRLLRNLPLDVRAVLTWDADNTDIDLWVTDPNGEKAYYGHRLTHQGGRMSLDFTGGYGPEEFSLKSAKPGIYKVQANFYGHRQQTVAGATTLQVKLITGFGTPRQQERIVTLRLAGQSEVVDVGELEIR